MNLKNFKTGIDILSKYYTDPEGYHSSAQHDEFYMHEPDIPVSDADQATLNDLGWDYDDGLGSWMAML